VTPDGGKPTEQFLDAGFLDDGFTISKDGRSIEGDGEYQLDLDTQLGKFILSLVERDSGKTVPEELLGDLRNYDALAGLRVTFVRVIDEEATKKLGKSKSKKTGKEYDRDNLLVSEVISLPDPKAAKGAKAKATPKAKASAPAAAPAAEAPAADSALAGDVDEELKAVLGFVGGSTELSKLGAAAVRYAMKNQDKYDAKGREALRVRLVDEANLKAAEERGVIVLADGTVVLAA
jgi:hypothetical protein